MKLVGRQAELATIREACLRARDGRGQVIVVSGDPGVGKTTLVDTIASELGGAFDVTCGRAWELADAPAYFPVKPCLKSLGIAADPARSEFELWEQVLEGLVRASAKRPVMWAVDDLHVADTQTLDLLCFVAQAIRALPIVLIATTRAKDPRLDDSAQQRIVRLVRNGSEVRLQPLVGAQVAALATQWLGREPSVTELAELVERTGGNPLFVIECARSKLDSVPQTVAVVVGERVAGLPEAARALVGDAAVLGNEFTAAGLGAMTDRMPARAIDDLAPVLRAGIVEELGPGRYKFSHALVRDAIEAAMSVQQRTAAHARALAKVEAAHAIDQARHAIASNAPNVVAIVERAIEQLEREGTFDRASGLCKQLDDLRAAGTLPPATSPELVRAARLALAAGKFAESRELCLRALAVASDETEYAHAALALGAELHPTNVDHVLVERLQIAQQRLGTASSPLRCRVSARLAAALQPAPVPLVPVEMARAAIADARAASDPALLLDVLYVAISAMTGFVDAKELRELNREHLDLALAANDAGQALRAYVRLIYAEGELGDFGGQHEHIEQMLQLATRVGHPRLIWRALLIGSMRAVARGQFSESDRFITEVERAMQLTDDPSLSLSLLAHRHHRALCLHRETTVANGLVQMEPTLLRLPGGPMILVLERGLAAARFGNPAAAEAALAGIAFDQYLTRDSSVLAILGEICAAGGTREQQRTLLERLSHIADHHIYFGHTPMAYCGPIRRVLGLLEIALGNRAAGEQHLRRALDTCRALGFATWVARIAFELGDHEEAARLATNLGIRGLAKRAHAPSVEVAPATRPSLGMWREGDVWRISYGVRVARIADSRGMELIAKLVERPGEEMHVLVLAGTGGEALTESHAGDALDERAARSYRERLAEVRDELAEAEANADRGRIDRLANERDFLEGELSRAFGMAGARKTGSMSERARVNVQRRIKDSLTRIGQHDSVIADYLRAAIRTGTYCTFRP